MNPTLDALRSLQAVESRIDSDRERLAQIATALADRAEYETARAKHVRQLSGLKRLEAEQRDVELTAASIRQQRAEVEHRLYGGRVSNARELSDLSQRVDDLKRQIERHEERLLGLMEQLDQARMAAHASEALLRDIVTARRALEAKLLGERKELQAEIGRDETERDRLRTVVDERALRTYDTLRKTRDGLAVVAVRQRTCQGCRIALTNATDQQVRHGEALVTCQNCGRLLYAEH
ncbi:MAG: hypothetical protein IT305_04955 [Chloroflexi bacterium]|nr:hypothetical protein [Chloroflexota bacterium]